MGVPRDRPDETDGGHAQRRLEPQRPNFKRRVHLRAAWIFTRADVIANLGVILSGLIIQLTGFGVSDLIVGAAIGLYVVKEAFEILCEAREAGEQAARL